MIRLIAIPNPRAGQAFIDYMASRSIEIQMMPEGEGTFALWLVDAEHQVEAESELHAFLNNPTARKYQSASWDMAESRTARFYYPRQGLLTSLKQNSGPFTLSIMVVLYRRLCRANAWLWQRCLFLASLSRNGRTAMADLATVYTCASAFFSHAHSV